MSARIYLSPPHMGHRERELLLEAFDSNWIAPLGPHVDAFERELSARTGVHAGALSSGTAALHLALIMLGVGRGDSVLVPSLTFAATANAVAYVGAIPVFVDATAESWNICPALVAEEIERMCRAGNRPKAVVTVDLYGQCADYDPIVAACKAQDIPIIEDAAEALGATYRGRAAGALGDIGVFSFNGNKIITTSGGGMLVSSDLAWVKRARHLATQAREPAPHYEHVEIGFNYRMSNLLAAVGRGQLSVLDERIAARKAVHHYYREHLSVPGIRFMPQADYGTWNGWLTCITIDPEEFGADREAIRLALESANIESRPVWKPMHMQPAFRAQRMVGGAVAERVFRDGLCLPSGSSLSTHDLQRIVECVLSTGRKS